MAANSVAESLSDDIFTGFWINRSHGSFYGTTLTLNRQYGGFLIAFLAVYVSLTGRSFWNISRFFMHSYYSTTIDTDGIYHQRQNTLRNARTAPDAVSDIFWIMLAWRKRAHRNVARLITVMTAAALISMGFAIASMYQSSIIQIRFSDCSHQGVFSSRVAANNSNEVILRGTGCGNQLSVEFEQATADFLHYKQRQHLEHLNVALQCYQNPKANHPRCHVSTKTKLPYTIQLNATCPFDDKMCRLTSGNLLLNTGLLDSLEDLGINRGPRFQLRAQRHCAPLVTKGFSTVYTDPDRPEDKFMRYTYGRSKYDDVSSDAQDAFMYEIPMVKPPAYVDSQVLSRSGVQGYSVR
jgi:uncharacterized membrane protein YccF (DUF307 family)